MLEYNNFIEIPIVNHDIYVPKLYIIMDAHVVYARTSASQCIMYQALFM